MSERENEVEELLKRIPFEKSQKKAFHSGNFELLFKDCNWEEKSLTYLSKSFLRLSVWAFVGLDFRDSKNINMHCGNADHNICEKKFI